ncbi:thermonuclease family protein [Amycolatopsis sp. CA-230715]|uniref:thermonuclease family protein n=1 Tax=Amycolatopsis sp. CA-230715 TaxID=2745196 RepID=UPI001C00CB9C|nr:excalibur calcium-binding domain-containing protein [Amycolatopsis sp. CA-230715]QWF76861.1 hypothetical protein HUW46_00241 [Amycolatopsis sp. CA-230715]
MDVRTAARAKWPNRAGIVLAAFGIPLVLGAVPACSPGGEGARQSSISPWSTTSPPSTTGSAASGKYLVTEIVDAGTVRVTGPLGVSLVRISGLHTPPANGTGCFGAESVAWARNALMNQYVTLDVDTVDPAVASVTLADGSDYSVLAVRAGYARFATAGIALDAARKTAEEAAEAAKRGLWAPPCLGAIDTPPASTSSAQQGKPAGPAPSAGPSVTLPPVPKTKAVPLPEPVIEAPAASSTGAPPPASGGGSVYYKNCDAARAAHAAPLHVGDPGYRPALDRDHDGTACE